jgi:hypothetical protein
MEILGYRQDLSKQGHQAALTDYYNNQVTLEAENDVHASLRRQEMLSSLSNGQFMSNTAQDTYEL